MFLDHGCGKLCHLRIISIGDKFVPFGEIEAVRDWLGITGSVGKPPVEVKGREVLGFECKRSEVSGQRFWGLLKTLCGTPENFFKSSFVYNYLPQQWMTSSGINLTPGEFNKPEVQELYRICDNVFHKVLELYEVEIIVAIGKFCETRAKETLKRFSLSRPIKILYMQHPSPRVRNNNDWIEKNILFFKENDLLQYYKQPST